MKVKVSYTVTLTPEQQRQCLRYAKSLGHAKGDPKPKVALQRLFQDRGESAVLTAAGAETGEGRR